MLARFSNPVQGLPKNRFEPYIAFTKLSAFTPQKIELVRGLNTQYQQRVILLTERELEPYHIYERTEKELGLDLKESSVFDLAQATHRIYFAAKAAQPANMPFKQEDALT